MKKLLFILSVSIVFACNNPASNKADSNNQKGAVTVYFNGDIITMVGEEPAYVEALAVKDGHILFVGTKEAATQAAGANPTFIDLKGQTLLPGFIDAHSHFANYADATVQADLNPPPVGTVTSIAGIISALQELKKKGALSDTATIIGYGYDQDYLQEKRHPTAADLDAAFPTNPVILKHTSGHMLVANTAAMRKAGVTAATKDPVGGTFIRKKGSKEPEGLAQEMAQYSFVSMLMAPSPEEAEIKKFKLAQDYYASCGVTTAAEHLALPEKVSLLQKAAAQKVFQLDVVVAPSYQMAKDIVGTGKINWGVYDNHVKFAGIKMATDGSPQGKTAFLSKPYLTPVPGCTHDCKGFPNMVQKEINELMLLCYKNKVQLFSHCNGDASIDMMIAGHQYACSTLGDSTSDRRTVIIHSQIMRPDQLALYKKYQLLPSFFTNHTFYWGDVHFQNLGKDRSDYLSPMKAAFDLGIPATNHTDCIVTPMDQLFLLWTSVNRVSRSGKLIGKEQRVSPYQGLKALTINGAYEYFEEKNKGTLEVGKMADLVVLNKNPIKVTPVEIKDIKVVETIKEGVRIYRR
ncbi:MAG: amidohydrolase [Sediminibacterium sp.]|nr:amidohydrolase [Sediminibacterium sp.]